MDILARAQFEPKLKERLGKPLVIENRTGGGTVIAATASAKAAPDGYTLFFAPAGTLTTNATFYKKLPYDPGKDFTPIALTSSVAFVLVVHPALPVDSVKELIAIRQGTARAISFGSTGIGATPHLAFEMIDARAGLKMTTFPVAACPGGEWCVGNQCRSCSPIRPAEALIKDGKLRRLRCLVASASARCRMCRPWRRPVLRVSMRCHGI